MKINPKNGIDKLLFGMKQKDVSELYGMPNKQFDDEEGNKIWIYNNLKLRLSFYEEEGFKLGYVISSNPELTLMDSTLIGQKVEDVKTALQSKGFKSWEQEDFDLAENFFNEDNWFILQSEFGVIAKVEIGAIINEKDEFDWKFKSK